MVQPQTLSLHDVSAPPDDRGAPERAAEQPCYRSEAFAEDLPGAEAAVAAAPQAGKTLLLWVAPFVAAVCGGLLTLFGVVA
jgi:hypothetical protein